MIKYLIAVLLFAWPATAQTICGPTEQVFSQLATAYGEEIVMTGMAGDVTMTIWANATTGTWTAALSKGQTTCIRAAGESFKLVPPKPNL